MLIVSRALGGGRSLSGSRAIVARLLFALALIVQIVAPVRSSVAMVSAAVDPFAVAFVCGLDHGDPDDATGDPPGSHSGDACALCQLVQSGGFAPPPPPPSFAPASTLVRAADWSVRVEPVANARLLDRIRGRAPPVFS
ncbi:MAG: DUF2946 family protein [Siculibacillus sp.]|nr:DUF2946 family protein [Siculibacillus sp.]